MGQLPESEWENEIARSILSIYHADLRSKLEAEVKKEQQIEAQSADSEIPASNDQRSQITKEAHAARKKQRRLAKKTAASSKGSGKTTSKKLNLAATFKANASAPNMITGTKDSIVHDHYYGIAVYPVESARIQSISICSRDVYGSDLFGYGP